MRPRRCPVAPERGPAPRRDVIVDLLDDVLVEACAPGDRASLEREIDLLIDRELGSDEPSILRRAATLLEREGAKPGAPRRLRLWAAVLRRRARC